MFDEANTATWGDEDYQRVLAELHLIFPSDAPENTHAQRCRFLCEQVWQYEQVHFVEKEAVESPAIEISKRSKTLVTA